MTTHHFKRWLVGLFLLHAPLALAAEPSKLDAAAKLGAKATLDTSSENAAKELQNAKRLAFLFIGDGAQRRPIEERVREWGLRHVIMQPYQPMALLAQSLSAPDVHLVTLRAGMEGLVLPSKVYGIAASGRPVLFIGDAGGEIAWVIEQAKCGVTVQRGDWSALVKYLELFKVNPQLCREMGQNARRLFEEKYQKPLAMRAWKELLSGIS